MHSCDISTIQHNECFIFFLGSARVQALEVLFIMLIVVRIVAVLLLKLVFYLLRSKMNCRQGREPGSDFRNSSSEETSVAN